MHRRRAGSMRARADGQMPAAEPSSSTLAMSAATIQRVSIWGACCTSLVVAACDGWLCSRGLTLGAGAYFIHKLVILSMLATWVVADTRASGRNFPSLDHGWFVMFVPFYLTYYLVSTRRWRGLLILAGMLMLLVLPGVAEDFMEKGS
jgi:hypothetical protein